MPRKRKSTINEDFLEFLKFLHLHNLINLICIIDSIPFYYETQTKKYQFHSNSNTDRNTEYSRVVYASDQTIEFNNVDRQKARLQNLTYIATKMFNVKFEDLDFQFTTFMNGPHSIDLENQYKLVVYSPAFNNAISSKKTMAKRYNLYKYDKDKIISIFNNSKGNYHQYLQFCTNRDTTWLSDISMIIYYHNLYNYNVKSKYHKMYIRDRNYKIRIMYHALKGLLSMPIRMKYDEKLEELLNLFYDTKKRIY